MALLKIEMQVSGRFKIEAFKVDGDGVEIPGTRRLAAPWQKNLILDQGLNTMATSASYLTACQVGTGSTAPAVGQTALVTRIAGTTTKPSNVTSVSGGAPYYVAQTVTYSFAQGVATGNLSEVGFGTATTGTTLFSRALIKDAMGNPTTLTVLSDESLEVTYEFRYYAPPSDVTGTIVATGNIGGTYDYILRPANVSTLSGSVGWTLPSGQTLSGTNSSGYRALNGDIGPITGLPSGTGGDMSNPASASYTSGSFVLDRIITATAAQANLSGGVRSMQLKLGVGMYQIQFDPPIPKTSVDVIQLTLRLSWARRP